MFRGFCVEIPSRKGSPSPIDSLALSSHSLAGLPLSFSSALTHQSLFFPFRYFQNAKTDSRSDGSPHCCFEVGAASAFGPVKIDLGVSFHCLRRNLQTAFVPSPLYPSIRSPMERIPFQMCVVGAFTLHTRDSSL